MQKRVNKYFPNPTKHLSIKYTESVIKKMLIYFYMVSFTPDPNGFNLFPSVGNKLSRISKDNVKSRRCLKVAILIVMTSRWRHY